MKKEKRTKVYFTFSPKTKMIFDIYTEKNTLNQSKYIEKLIIDDIKNSNDFDYINNQLKKEYDS